MQPPVGEADFLCSLFLFADLIGEHHQALGKVDVLDRNGVDVEMEVGVGEVPDATDAAVAEDACDLAGIYLRHGEHTDIGMILGAVFSESLYIIYGNTRYLGADKSRVGIKGSNEPEAVLEKVEVIDNGLTEVTCADDNGILLIVEPEDLAYRIEKAIDRIAIALLAEAAKAVKVLPDLRSSEAHTVAQFFGRYLRNTHTVQFAEMCVVSGKASDNGL